MDSCGIFFIVVAIGLIIVIPFALRASSALEAKIQERRDAYRRAKSAGEPVQIIAAARALIQEARLNKVKQAEVAQEVYKDLLTMLKLHSEYKPFALETGRLAYGLKRNDGVPTVYDEQAILNDINVHA